MTTHLVIGGTCSGKSGYAERLASDRGAPVVYVATGRADDPEMAERVTAHRRRRPDGWIVRETTDVAGAIAGAPTDATVLVDDLEGWLVAAMTRHALWTDAAVAPLGPAGRRAAAAVIAESEHWWELARTRAGATVVVAGQPGNGIVPVGAASRRYVDLHGQVTTALSGRADLATLVVAGRPVPLPTPSTRDPVDRPLRLHGDTQVPPGAVDLAVNVLPGPPAWLSDRLATVDLASYPDDEPARRAVAARHGRDPDEVVPLAGAAEGFWLVAAALRPRAAACVHPGFTEAEAALRANGTPIVRVQRDPSTWSFDPADVPAHVDLVVVGRPDNPTGVVDPDRTLAALRRPGRTVVVDEAFADFLPDGDGVAGTVDLDGLIVLRSPTKLWGLAGLRVGYALAPTSVARRLRDGRQPWPVSTVALDALVALSDAEDERSARAAAVAADRDHLVASLRTLDDVQVWDSRANFVLVRTSLPDLREQLLSDGLAVRRGDTFPGLDRHHVRIAVRPAAVTDRLVAAIGRHLDHRSTV